MRLLPPFHSQRSPGQSQRPRWFRPQLEELEGRYLLSAPSFHETLDQSLNLSVLAPGAPLIESGSIGNGPDGAADVNFYQFTLAQSAHVQLEAQNSQRASPSTFVLSLYDTDPLDPEGNRLLAQSDGATHGGQAEIDTALAAGVYYLAVSGSGNSYFYPYLEGSGYFGDTGAYQLSFNATTVTQAAGDGPIVLRTEPSNGAVLTASPLVLIAGLSGPVDPSTLQADTTIQLYYDATDPFTSSAGVQLTGTTVSYDAYTQEIDITPPAPLAPGYYQLVLLGNQDVNAQVIETADATPIPLGATQAHPDGQDFTTTFQVVGNEGITGANPGPDDTLATARDFGNVTNKGLVQIAGAIGDDSTDPIPFDPGNVNVYHFQVSGSGNYAFGAEVFAGRIDSQLGASIQLYRLDANGTLEQIASNDGSLDAVLGDNFSEPLYLDPVLYASVTAGDYYLAVTSAFTTYDLQTSHSGSGGFTTGPYVLNLRVDPSSVPPEVVASQLTAGEQLTSPPTTFTVQFEEPVNLQQLAYEAYLHTFSGQIPMVSIQSDGGATYYPRLTSYDPTTDTATFLMLDALPNGDYTLHLSGPNGLTDLAGNPLVGNDPTTGDYVVPFSVNGPMRGTPGNPTLWTSTTNTDPNNPQPIGTLFPIELQNTVMIDRELGSDTTTQSTAVDYYSITVLQSHSYEFILIDTSGLAVDVTATIWLNGVQQATLQQGANGALANLDPGTYVIGVDWSGAASADVSYQLAISLQGSPEPATSLTTGPAPALRLRLAVDSPPPPTNNPGTPGITTPPSDGTSGTSPPVQASSTSSTPPLFILSTVALALSERALGAATDPIDGARAFLREPTNVPTQVTVIEYVRPLLLSGDQATTADEQFLAASDFPFPNATALGRDLAARVTDIENVLARATRSGSRKITEYSAALTNRFESWQFENHASGPSLPTSEQKPAAVSVPATSEDTVEQPAAVTDEHTPNIGGTTWRLSSQVGRIAIAAFSMMLVALRFFNRHPGDGAKVPKNKTKETDSPLVLQGETSSGD